MSWLQLTLSATTDTAKDLESLLEEVGATSVTMVDAADQPLFEPGPGETPLWNNILVTGLFPADRNAELIIAQLKELFTPLNLPAVESQILPEQDWQRAWMDDFKPMQFGERLWICPSWCDIPDPQAATILLDPGLAFGTGTHPTTALCLQWLDKQALEGQTLIDYGCGSGILGIAALLLKAVKVYGVDNDPQALIATADNCTKNSLDAAKFPTYLPDIFANKLASTEIGQADGMLANILAGPLIDLTEYLSAMVKPKGWILLSGILVEQAEAVSEAYSPWFKMDPPEIHDGWVRLTGIRKSLAHK